MTQPSKPDLVLSDGREITIDLNKITNKEFTDLFNKNQPVDEEKAILFRMTGITQEEYPNLSVGDTKRIWTCFFQKVQNPLENPT